MSNTAFALVRLEKIAVSLTNPRKNFNGARMLELTDSIRAGGVHQPILLRPLPGYRVTDTMRDVEYEIVAGERRYRASELAGLEDIPAMIRALTDDQVLEIQIIENLQRDDLTDLEEAEGYEALMEHAGLSANQVGKKIGKSNSYVYQRLKLLDLSIECKQAMRTGEIDGRRALLIARIPDSKLQAKALEAATKKLFSGDLMSVRDFQAWLQTNVMLRLEHATFKITDARLVEAAGSCKDCPKRTGANPDLFTDVVGADICIDPACFHGKEEAHRNALRLMAEKKGMRVIEGDEAEELLPHSWSNDIEGYTSLGQIRNDITVDGTTGHTLRELLGSDAPGAVLFEHPRTKELMELVPTDESEGVLLAKGLLKADVPKGTKPSSKQLEHELAILQRRFEYEQENAIEAAIQRATHEAAHAATDEAAKALMGSGFLRAWLQYQMDNCANEFMAKALGYVFQEGEDETDALVQHIKACSHADLCRAIVLVAMNEESSYTAADSTLLIREHLTTTLNIPVKVISAKATKAVKDKFTAEIKAVQVQIDVLKMPDLPLASAAQPEHAGGKDSKESKVKEPKPRASKAKLSAEDALSGIAAAIQDEEQAQTAAPEGTSHEDALYQEAVALVREKASASISLVQRHLNIGYNQSARLLDRMEAGGLITAMSSTGVRSIISQHDEQPAPVATKTLTITAKYRGVNGEMWSGRGLKPKWVMAYIDQGGALENLLVQPEQSEADPLYTQALALIIREQKASKRLFKEELRIGQTKALQLLDELEQAGKVSPVDERGARKVLVVA